MLRRTRSTLHCISPGQAGREIIPLGYISNTFMVPGGGLGGGVYGGRGLRRTYDELMQGCASATNLHPAAVWNLNIGDQLGFYIK